MTDRKETPQGWNAVKHAGSGLDAAQSLDKVLLRGLNKLLEHLSRAISRLRPSSNNEDNNEGKH